MPSNLPEITYRYPTLSNGAQSNSRPSIVFDWSTDMVTTQFSDNAQRAVNFVLMDDTTSTIVPTNYVSYTTASKRFEIQPASALTPNKTYRVMIKNKLLSSDGRRSFNEYHWTFLTASGSISEVNLLSPGDSTVQPIGPALSWQTISFVGSAGSAITVNYRVEVSTRFDFGNIAYTTDTTASSITPNHTYVEGTTYYWRVMPFTVEATGFWSDTWQYYYGRLLDADATTRQYLPEADSFGVKKLGFKTGSTNLSTFPASLSINFTSVPASNYASYITVLKKSVLPRNDVSSSYDESAVAGSWALSASTITFTPSEAITNNTRYEISLSSEMRNTSDFELGEDYAFWFTSRYSPFYVSPRVIRARFLGAEQKVPDDLINFYIYQASLEANARYWGYNSTSPWDGDTLTEGIVRDSSNLVSYGVLKWTEAAAAYKILKAILFEHLRDIGRTERLGDSLISLTKDFIAGIDKAISLVKEELTQWEQTLAPSDIPVSVAKSSEWTPVNWDYDWAVKDLEGLRDNNFNE